MFIYKIYKNDEIETEDFERAIYSLKDCIESVLYNVGGVVIAVKGNLITITADNITEKECKEKIKGCLCDSTGSVYPQFLRVELLSKKS